MEPRAASDMDRSPKGERAGASESMRNIEWKRSAAAALIGETEGIEGGLVEGGGGRKVLGGLIRRQGVPG